jgi:hypothetical protein
MEKIKNISRTSVGELVGKWPLGMPTMAQKHNMSMDLRKINFEGRKWMKLAQD